MQRLLALCLSFLGGYIDTAGFLFLEGLFTAHVTGNFVTLGASFVHGASGGVVKILALPVFCLTILCLGLWARAFLKSHRAPLRVLLLVQTAFLAMGGGLAITYGPFENGHNSLALTLCGLLLVIAMAIQNAGHKVHLASHPPSTLMTGTTTQIMVDIADLIHSHTNSRQTISNQTTSGPKKDEIRQVLRKRLSLFVPALVAFALGCAAGAYGVALLGPLCFTIPPLITLLCSLLVENQPPAKE
ncbi:YoaK family protein [Entomobacter blattae]|uniref:DUF1275 domain-containing protein n=1 Tax=Entomobacter blattae TaxID=2762277 RepID=A0A7H1NRS1_9PROT|nr:YoaK family protein [Entomobacter blattae]QNT78481.1 hypothetical protein JGUZn3_12550 [Entomobacter blattae]